jgi:hypothetical protein
MKKITNILVITILCLVVQAQEPVLSPRLKEYYRIKMEMNNLYSEFSWAENRTKDTVAMREILARYEENRQRLQQFPEYFRPSWDARNYADMLAVFARYAEAVALYDTAFYHRQMEAYDFNLPYRRAYFAGDTLLHQRKLAEYQQAECGLYSYNELQVRRKLWELQQMDQMAIKLSDMPGLDHELEVRMLAFKDSILKASLAQLQADYPEIEDVLSLDFFAKFLLGRHLYSADPDYWFEVEYSRSRKLLESGQGSPESYAHTYDFYLMRTGKGKSYYGQYGCSDDLTPADTAEINRHRTDIGLEPLEAERRDKNVIYITY